jgi:hypothetical protein
MTTSHDWPRKGDAVHQQWKEDHEEWPHGRVISIDRDYQDIEQSKVLVLFKQPLITRRTKGSFILIYNDNIFWDARKSKFFVILENPTYEYTGDEYSWGGETDIKEFWFSDFEGCWSSSQGGMARWEIP